MGKIEGGSSYEALNFDYWSVQQGEPKTTVFVMKTVVFY